jgi:glycosyltransferase involved in cell wall biosynthesis
MFASKASDVLRIKKLNTLFLSYDGMTDNLGQSQVIPYLIGLSKIGYSITIISCEKPEAFQNNHVFIQNLLTANNIDWQPLTYTKKPPVISTLWDIQKIKKSAAALHKSKKFKLFHCRSYITTLAVADFSKNNSIPLVFDMRGFWADERVEGRIWNLKNPLFKTVYRFFKKKELEFVHQAKAIVSLTHAAKREIQTWNINEESKQKIYVIPCSVDFELFAIPTDSQINLERKRLGFGETDFVICYLGSLGTWYMLNEMLDFFVVLKSKQASAKFYFLTPDNKDMVYERAAQKGIDIRDIVVESAIRSEVPKKLGACDFGISFIQPSFSKIASSPTKMGELLAMGIPLVVNSKVGDVEEITLQTKGGICLSEFSTKQYSDAVQMMQESKAFSRNEIRSNSLELYSLKNAIDTYSKLYDFCLQPN